MSASQLIECVPNFSEGRRPEVIEAIVQSITSVSHIQLLHQTSDADHNRTVVTFVGTPNAVQEAAFKAIERASQLIDMTQHRGVHPRIGATDVVPFVPIQAVTMAECVKLAQQLGARVGDELGLPVYLYAHAATRPDRVDLASIRRGEYEGLIQKITSTDYQPDYGLVQMGQAGAVVIGARQPLIAYNVYLTTDDVTVARNIARAIRGSSGGLRGVKALGLLVKGRAQVSMNLVDYQHTPLHRVMELIRIEAARYGTQIYESELIGLMPQDALIQAASWYLQLPDLQVNRLLEQVIDYDGFVH